MANEVQKNDKNHNDAILAQGKRLAWIAARWLEFSGYLYRMSQKNNNTRHHRLASQKQEAF